MPRAKIYFESIEIGEKIEALPRTITETYEIRVIRR
jgi:hypothetical protein